MYWAACIVRHVSGKGDQARNGRCIWCEKAGHLETRQPSAILLSAPGTCLAVKVKLNMKV